MHAQIRARGADADAVGERLGLKVFLHELANLIELTDRYNQIEIETDQRLHVGVDSLTAYHAEAHLVVPEQSEDFLQEIGFVHSNGLPERECFHGAGALRLALLERRYLHQAIKHNRTPQAPIAVN
jgi:hypothetical protein